MGRRPLLALKAPLTAPRCGRPLQPNPPGMQRGFQGAPHPPRTHGRSHSIMSLCTPNRSPGTTGLGSSPACSRAAPRAVSCLCIQPSREQLSLVGAAWRPCFSPSLGVAGSVHWGAEPLTPLPPPGAEQRAAPTAAHGSWRHIHCILSAGAQAEQDLLAQGSRSSLYT